ncbi:conserved hypothetical protein [delta proteobacterium NaphS2]|nr:conserved hypothetical protein [delta proteobacterium NaphS2]
MVQSGTATLPELIGDRAMAFGLAAALGMTAARLGLPPRNYRRHLAAMPFRTSVFTTDHPRLLPPLTRRLNLDAEAGLQRKIQDMAKKGNLKDFFHVQEVPSEQVFKGAVFGLDGFDPFDASDTGEIVIRVGLHRNGMVLLTRAKTDERVHLNAATAATFDRELEVERYCLHSMQLTPPMDLNAAATEVIQWM